jgi:hypothetical protein
VSIVISKIITIITIIITTTIIISISLWSQDEEEGVRDPCEHP